MFGYNEIWALIECYYYMQKIFLNNNIFALQVNQSGKTFEKLCNFYTFDNTQTHGLMFIFYMESLA